MNRSRIGNANNTFKIYFQGAVPSFILVAYLIFTTFYSEILRLHLWSTESSKYLALLLLSSLKGIYDSKANSYIAQS